MTIDQVDDFDERYRSVVQKLLKKYDDLDDREIYYEVNNEARASWAARCVELFMEMVGSDPGDAISDLVCDLMHLAQITGQNPWAQVRRGAEHFKAEQEEEAEQCQQ
jgi:hypothetical protein